MSASESDKEWDALLMYAKECVDMCTKFKVKNINLIDKNKKLIKKNEDLKDKYEKRKEENEKLKSENIKLKEDKLKLNTKNTENMGEKKVETGKTNEKVTNQESINDNDAMKKQTEMEAANEMIDTNLTPRETKHTGLAVICCHGTFDRSLQVENLPTAELDASNMENTWKLYGCKVVKKLNETSSFYGQELTNTIINELKNITDIKLFVFVLSTHGCEYFMKKENTIEHFFATKNNIMRTQKLVDEIGKIEQLKEKLKFFVIQACRSRMGDKDAYDYGHDVMDERTRTDGKKDVLHEVHRYDADTVARILSVPNCDDCIIIFGSMSGKYSFGNSRNGSYVIEALKNALMNNQCGDEVHIFDILRNVNSEVGKKDLHLKSTTVKTQSCFFHNMACKLEDLVLHKSKV